MRWNYLVVSLLCAQFCSAQQFNNVTNQNFLAVDVGTPELGSGLSTYDFNEDGWDDLTFATEGNGIYLFVNNEGQYTLLTIIPNGGNAKSVLWADYDNDGDPDLFISNDGAACRLLNNDGLCNLTDVSEAAGLPTEVNGQSYGAAWADIDLDGNLDLYICNYDWGQGPTNWLLVNQGDGTFVESAAQYGIGNGQLPSFMPCFADFNNDLLPDLYIINDKSPLNALFIADEELGFIDYSDFSNTDIQVDAMSNTIGDYDRDGDLDIYVTNNSDGNRLLRNEGNLTFTEDASTLGISVNRFSWGALWFDVNNDRFLDLFVSTQTPQEGNSNPYFRNTSGNTFTEFNTFSPSNLTPSFANSYLDYNNDGALDLAQVNNGPFGVSLWRNNSVQGNWLKVNLEGTFSNKEGIGAWIDVYANSQLSRHYTQCGEGYLSQRSQRVHFGLVNAQKADSVIVNWPSGWVDRIYDVNANQTIQVTEGMSFSMAIDSNSQLYLCEGDSLMLDGGDFESHLWSNGTTNRYVTVYEPMFISVEVTTEQGFSANSQTIFIQNAPPFVYELNTEDINCYGDSTGAIELTSNSDFDITWSNDAESSLLSNLPAGMYEASVIDAFGCTTEIELELTQNEDIFFSGETLDALCFNSATGAISPTITGGFGNFVFEGELENLVAGEYIVTAIDELGCEASQTFTIDEPNALAIEFDVTHSIDGALGLISSSVSGGTSPYSIVWSNSATTFVNANLAPGVYVLNVTDLNGCQLSEECLVEAITSIDEYLLNTIEVYPNPTNGQLFIRNLPDGKAHFSVYNALGKCVFIKETYDRTIDLSHCISGVYTVVIEVDNLVFRKVVVIR